MHVLRLSMPVWLRDRRFHEMLWFCAPALLIGLALRTALIVSMPYAYYQPDSPDLLTTAEHLLFDLKWELHPKKTFLVPLLYSALCFVPGTPLLVSVPVVQHALGLLLILIVGGLVRLWFVKWRWLIVPVTLLIAIHPSLMQFEHTLMAETGYVVCVAGLGLAATVFALRKSRAAFAGLAVALLLTAGARPEGKLFFAFGVLLPAVVFGHDRGRMVKGVGIMAGLALATHFLTKTSQAGLLLYTALYHLTPDRLWTAPDFAPRIAAMQAEAQTGWARRPTFPSARQRKEIYRIVDAYLAEKGLRSGTRGVNKFCQRIGIETLLRNLHRMPAFFFQKFRHSASYMTAGEYEGERLERKQWEGYAGDMELALRLSPWLHGRQMESEEDIRAFIRRHYRAERLGWFNALHDGWEQWTLRRFRMADPPWDGGNRHGLAYWYLAALCGLALAAARPSALRFLHVLWGLTLLGMLFVIVVTGAPKPRFRFVFEPFFVVYAGLLLDVLWWGAQAVWQRCRNGLPSG